MRQIKTSALFYILVLIVGVALGYLSRNQSRNQSRSFVENLDCTSDMIFYSETDTDTYKFDGKISIKLSPEKEGIVQLVGQMFVNNESYNVFRKIEVFYDVIHKNDVVLKTKKLILFPRLDNLPKDIEKKFFFKIYYEPTAEMNYEFSHVDDKQFVVSVSLVPRFVCTAP